MKHETKDLPECRLRWLHITDLHIGLNNESQRTAIDSLIDAIVSAAGEIPFDVVFLSGDLAYSGKKEEYETLEAKLLIPLRKLHLFRDAEFIAAPGNHDLNCDSGYPPVWASLGQSRQAAFFHLDESGTRTRSGRSLAFSAYQDFVARCGIRSVDPTREPARLDVLEVRDRKFAVITAVTAFFSDKEVSDYLKSPAPVHPLRTLLQSADSDAQRIVIGHHPVTWFTSESEKQLRSLLAEQKVLYLNGHEHETTSTFGGRGLISLGFGAAYQAPLDGAKQQYYRNSFAICELDDLLHVHIVSWDSEHGKWRTDQNLPSDFVDRSERLPDGFSLTLPSTRIATSALRPLAALAASIRIDTEFERCVWIAGNSAKRWVEILLRTGHFRNITETYNLPTQTLAAGHYQFRVKDQRGNHLVHAIAGSGDVLNYEQLQSLNTELDKQNYDGCIIATLGTLSEEAKTLAAQLKSRKPITLLERDQIIRELLRSSSAEFKSVIRSFDATEVKASLVVGDSDVSLLLQERASTSWFVVFDEKGKPFSESNDIVMRLRNDLPEFRSVRFRVPETDQMELSLPVNAESGFDRTTYLEESYKHFDDVKYAPLAALGFRFRKASLSEIYVSASADVNGNSKNSQSINRAVTEFIDTLNLPRTQRDQLESQMRSRLGIERTAEVGAARLLYQRFNSVVVLGDPGSGKTCFVKHEILAYCRPPVEGGSWYSTHLPVYVSLAEAARLINDETGILEVCEILSARRGALLPKTEIIRGLSEGKVAFFFDGLDEVGFIDKRIQLIGEIDQLVKDHAHRGNRFVLASRPAAVQPVEIPEGLTYLHLKGLSESEMRILAGRVLTVRLGEGEEKGLTSDEAELVEKLLEDTKHNPGIARIARNPLLLTLLVLIYANTGAISAKRHMIYTQAIKTLVSVRGRQTREQQISEADLRTRLGSVAVAIFGREVAEIPRRAEVLKILSPFFIDLPNSSDLHEGGNGFIQEVAEATGLLSIHEGTSTREDDLITFMHYSFLEYYAAAGLLSKSYLSMLPQLSGNPRWKDVVTLLFGILSEQGDVTPALSAILRASNDSESITAYKLLLCLDCASECDVPPVAAQQLLSDEVYNSVASGAGRFSAKARDALASKLGYFLQGAGSRFDAALVRGLACTDAGVAAAFADLIARLPDEVVVSDHVCTEFKKFLGNANPVSTAACMYAVERRPELRSAEVKGALIRALKGSLIEKHAGLRVLAVVPGYVDDCTDHINRLLHDSNEFIASTAARCILGGNIGLVRWQENPSLQEILLAKLALADEEGGVSLPGITLDRQQIESMLDAESKNERELALRYLPLLRHDVSYVYQTLIRILRSSAESRHRSACLDSLRSAPQAIDLITIADTDLICACLQAEERNVRISAIRLLGEMPDDEQVIRSLEENFRLLKSLRSRDAEISETAKALAKHARRSPKLRPSVLKLVFEHLPKSPDSGFGDATDQQHLIGLLVVCESLGVDSDDAMASQLLAFAEDYRTPESVRRHSLRVFGRLAEPSTDNADTLVRLLGRNDPRMNEATYAATLSFVGRCRKRVDFVRRVNPRLAALREKLIAAWTRETPVNAESVDLSGARDIRDSIVGTEELVVQYSEFSERATPTATQA